MDGFAVPAVHERPADALLIAADHGHRAGALVFGIAVPATWAGVPTKPGFSCRFRLSATSKGRSRLGLPAWRELSNGDR
jgi:hypothetical protein